MAAQGRIRNLRFRGLMAGMGSVRIPAAQCTNAHKVDEADL